jgi:hypothetical protein
MLPFSFYSVDPKSNGIFKDFAGLDGIFDAPFSPIASHGIR